jgi:hypothetical protein
MVILLVLLQLPVMVHGHLFLVGKEMAALLLGVPLHVMVFVGDRPLLPVFMGRGLRLVGLHSMMLLLLLLLVPWELRLPGLARADMLLLLAVIMSTYMRMVVGPLVVLMHMLVLARTGLMLQVLVDIKLLQSSLWWWCKWYLCTS